MIEFDIGVTSHLALFSATACVAGLVRGFSGFGGPATISLILTQLFAPAALLPKILLLDICALPILIWNVRHHTVWRLSLPMALAAASVSPFGLYAMHPVLLKRMIGLACLVGIAVAMGGYRFSTPPSMGMNISAAVVFGFILSSTFIAVPMVTYFFLMPMPAERIRATVISFSILVMPTLAVQAFAKGMLDVTEVLPIALAGTVYFVMIAVGSMLFERVSGNNYRKVVMGLLLVLSVAAIF